MSTPPSSRASASRPRTQSDDAFAHGRAKWTDPVRIAHTVDFSVGSLTFAELYALKRMIVGQSSQSALVDLHGDATGAVLKAGGSFYGSFGNAPAGCVLESPEVNELRIRFEEAAG
jgi:hypothetical protein